MDKQSNKISIKINGEEKTISEDQNVKKEPLPQTESDEFTWVLPEKQDEKIVSIEDLRHVKQSKKPLKKKSFSPSHTSIMKKIVLVVSLAVVVGVGLGMFSLKVMTNNEEVVSITNSEEPSVETGGSLSESPAKTPTKQDEPVKTVKAQSLYVVQAGVFSSKESGETAQKEMKEKGYTATSVASGENRLLLVGMGSEAALTKQLGESYKAKGEEVYVKEYGLPTSGSLSQKDVDVMEKIQPILVSLSMESNRSMLGQKLEAFKSEKESLTELEKATSNKEIQALITHLLKANDALLKYEKSTSEQEAKVSQQQLLDGLQQYVTILTK
ncbi:SPOR domain-containing protein [Bacillus sp. CGMCC 1.16541]|uniref:SPOR domain-containing protein n=1 Tax=Bacillus sp. CGMCC 1.16541 TaxID=2185143 RepID=UPI000D72EE24|nr:SPOR domain-containing protein [Bacillus sp. CGMCC 1.16541]